MAFVCTLCNIYIYYHVNEWITSPKDRTSLGESKMCSERQTICSNRFVRASPCICTYPRIYSKCRDGIWTAEEVHRFMGRVRHLFFVKYLYRRSACSSLPHDGAINHRPPQETSLIKPTLYLHGPGSYGLVLVNMQWLKVP